MLEINWDQNKPIHIHPGLEPGIHPNHLSENMCQINEIKYIYCKIWCGSPLAWKDETIVMFYSTS